MGRKIENGVEALIYAGVVGTFCVGIGAIVFGIISCQDSNANGEIREAKGKSDQLVASDVGAESVDLSLMEVESSQNNEYLLNLYGSATLKDGSTIDLMTARYKMNQATYVNLMSKCDGSSSKSLANLDNISYGMRNENLTDSEVEKIVTFLNGLSSAIQSADFVGSTLDGTIEAVSDQKLICYVSAPKEVNGKTSVDVIYAQPSKSGDKKGIASRLVTVSLNSQNQAEKVEEESQIFTQLGDFDMLLIDEDFVKSHYEAKKLQNEGRAL